MFKETIAANEAAKVIGCSRSAIRNYIRDNKIQSAGYEIINGFKTLTVVKESVEAFKQQREQDKQLKVAKAAPQQLVSAPVEDIEVEEVQEEDCVTSNSEDCAAIREKIAQTKLATELIEAQIKCDEAAGKRDKPEVLDRIARELAARELALATDFSAKDKLIKDALAKYSELYKAVEDGKLANEQREAELTQKESDLQKKATELNGLLDVYNKQRKWLDRCISDYNNNVAAFNNLCQQWQDYMYNHNQQKAAETYGSFIKKLFKGGN